MKNIVEYINEARYPGYNLGDPQFTTRSFELSDELKIDREYYEKIDSTIEKFFQDYLDDWGEDIDDSDISKSDISKLIQAKRAIEAFNAKEMYIYHRYNNREYDEEYAVVSLYDADEKNDEFYWDILGTELTIRELYDLLLKYGR